MLRAGPKLPATAFKPLRDEHYNNAVTMSYLNAFAELRSRDPDAIAAFAAHIGKHPKDQLASFHLKRLLNGATGVHIEMDRAGSDHNRSDQTSAIGRHDSPPFRSTVADGALRTWLDLQLVP